MGEERDVYINVRLSEFEKHEIELTAKKAGLRTSSYVRKVMRTSAGLGDSYLGDDKKALIDLARSIDRIGRNLNQIARTMNSGTVPSLVKFETALTQVADGYVKLEDQYLSMCLKASDLIENLEE